MITDTINERKFVTIDKSKIIVFDSRIEHAWFTRILDDTNLHRITSAGKVDENNKPCGDSWSLRTVCFNYKPRKEMAKLIALGGPLPLRHEGCEYCNGTQFITMKPGPRDEELLAELLDPEGTLLNDIR